MVAYFVLCYWPCNSLLYILVKSFHSIDYIHTHACYVYFSYKVLFNELKCIDSVVEGTEKLLKPFLHCINNGTLECASEEVRTAVVS